MPSFFQTQFQIRAFSHDGVSKTVLLITTTSIEDFGSLPKGGQSFLRIYMYLYKFLRSDAGVTTK